MCIILSAASLYVAIGAIINGYWLTRLYAEGDVDKLETEKAAAAIAFSLSTVGWPIISAIEIYARWVRA